MINEQTPIIGRFSRRAMLIGAVAVIPVGGVAKLASPEALAPDPLADTIAEYYAKLAEFEAIPHEQVTQDNEDALVAATYGPLSDRLWHATPPATSNRGVAEAIRYALETHSLIDRVAEAALRSALAFLDGERLS
ncbi:hypothetical protein MesoLj131b_38200 [Mesorhizobium sp. 131-2-5]|uniref:hypothetical protein n=1 Tax=Mesorhizobium sp. 131-2-5 TaxID=2744519 RepID=UPI0019265471|nr:hypothetical protein [Mesorhizobium sp. 131-2-5]BCH01821.1 hypothetical protein MesoLj131b_38200 [Mesorhizobium sp. 131-2-5]